MLLLDLFFLMLQMSTHPFTDHLSWIAIHHPMNTAPPPPHCFWIYITTPTPPILDRKPPPSTHYFGNATSAELQATITLQHYFCKYHITRTLNKHTNPQRQKLLSSSTCTLLLRIQYKIKSKLVKSCPPNFISLLPRKSRQSEYIIQHW